MKVLSFVQNRLFLNDNIDLYRNLFMFPLNSENMAMINDHEIWCDLLVHSSGCEIEHRLCQLSGSLKEYCSRICSPLSTRFYAWSEHFYRSRGMIGPWGMILFHPKDSGSWLLELRFDWHWDSNKVDCQAEIGRLKDVWLARRSLVG